MGHELEQVKNNEQVSEVEPKSDHRGELEPECDPEVYPVPEPECDPEVNPVPEPETGVKPIDPEFDPVPESEPELEVEPVDPEVDHVPEPEPEPEPEVEPVPTDSCEDVDIEPLSGKPYFPIVMVKSNIGVARKYQLTLPAQFVRMLPNKTIPVILTRGGRSWETALMGEAKPAYRRFDSRWRAFAEDNNLKVGDVCVFELMEISDTLLEFKVQVLRGDFPSKLLHKEDGTFNNPIVVD